MARAVFGGNGPMEREEWQEIRLERGWTQSKLAELLGCSRDLVKDYERGRARITERKAEALLALAANPPPIERAPRVPGRAGRPPGTANRPRYNGNGTWDDNWSPEVAMGSVAATVAVVSLSDVMRSPWFWVVVALIAVAVFWLWKSNREDQFHPNNEVPEPI